MVAAFLNPVDIANRALQHVGSPRIAAFTDNSKPASEAGFVYDKLRRAELRRSVWKFATRRISLRAVTATTQLVSPAAWAVGTTYAAFALVSDSTGAIWQSLAAGNVGNTPAVPSAVWAPYFGSLSADTWDAAISYFVGELVLVGTTAYISLINGNLNHAPAGGAPNWLSLGTVLTTLVILSPFNYGVAAANPKKIFRLPYGFLRLAQQDAKTAAVSVLSTSGGARYNDWEIRGKFMLSANSDPVLFQFVADICDVSEFDDLFCEGLAARIALDLVEPLTQSQEKLGTIAKIYSMYIAEARKVNSIELGATENEEMEYDPLLGGMSAPQTPPPQQGR